MTTSDLVEVASFASEAEARARKILRAMRMKES
jgi:hypothetical protein